MSGKIFIVAFGLSLLSWVVPAHANERTPAPTLFAAASLTDAIMATFEIGSFEGRISTTFASSATLARQIESGAPADLFISASEEWVTYLEDKNLIPIGNAITLAENRLILLAPNNSTLAATSLNNLLTLNAISKLGLGEPDSVPVGIYARQSLQALGHWDEINKNSLVLAQSATTLLHWLEREEVDAAILYQSDLYRSDKVKFLAHIPESTHKTIRYLAVPTTDLVHPEIESLLSFIRTPEGQAIFRKKGFIVP